MLERTMKSFGAAVVFLAVNNLLTDIQVSSTTLPPVISISTTGPGKGLTKSRAASGSEDPANRTHTGTTEDRRDESSSTIGYNLSSITENVLSTSTSRSTTISNLTSPTASTVDSPRALTTEDMNKDVTAYMSTASPKEESTAPSVGAEATTLGTPVSSKEATTEPSRETQTQTQTQTTKPAITNKVSSKEATTEPSRETQTQTQTTRPAITNKVIKIGVGCVAAVITVIVLVVIYKICQKKPPAVENTGVKTSAETKENVKLLSVKTEAPNSDTKRTSSNQMEYIEC